MRASLFFLFCVALATMLGCGTTPTVTPTLDAAPQTDVRVEASPEVGTSLVCVANDAADCAGQCGEILNRCGNVVDCGGCDLGQVCGAGGPNHCGVGTCTPSCVGRACGSDGCAALCGMGGCGLGQACIGGACHCDPVVCQGCCGTDGSCQACDCGGNGKPCCAGSPTCSGALTCAGGTCGGCQPNCAGAACGDGDGCGGKCTANCPTCDGLSCRDGCCNGLLCDRSEGSGACGVGGKACVSCFATGQSCNAGQCGLACGGSGDPCCTSETPCDPGQTCGDAGTCAACGTAGSSCCSGTVPCPSGSCNAGLCEGPDSGSCGSAGGFCCEAGAQCTAPGTVCNNDRCTNCGLGGQRCCTGQSCASTFACELDGTCHACGNPGEPCCAAMGCAAGAFCVADGGCQLPPDAGMPDSGQPDSGGGMDSSQLDSGTLQDSTVPLDTNMPDSGLPPPIDSSLPDSTQMDTNLPPLDSNLPDSTQLDTNLPPVDVTSPDGGACFVAGTPVAMANGLSIPIETVKEGDLVRSYDPSADRVVNARVLERIQHGASASAGGLVLINGTLRATLEHPFYVNGAAVRAEELKEGMPLLILSEHSVVQTRTVRTVERVSGGVETFELRVAGSGLYFVDSMLGMTKDAGQ